MRVLSLIAISLFLHLGVTAQTITIDECQRLARENHPAIAQYGLIEKSVRYTVANAKTNWWPQATLSAQATYQSETPALPDELSAVLASVSPTTKYEGLKNEQYSATLQIEQIIWGGGAIKAQMHVAEAEGLAMKANWETAMYAIRERVNQLYFGTLMIQERLVESDLQIGELERHDKLIRAFEASGMANRNDLDLIRAELLTAVQQRSELAAMLKTYRTMLGIMIGRDLGENNALERPQTAFAGRQAEDPLDFRVTNNRPELKYFDSKERVLDAQRKSVNASVLPQIGAFIQGAYGYPSPDFFKSMSDSRPRPYYIAGVRLQWRFGGLYTRGNRLAQIENERSQITSQRESFLYDQNLRRTQESIAIERMREVMRGDDEIIELRAAIRKRTETGVANGTKSVSDLLGDIAAENIARRNKIIHEIELLKAIYDLKFTENN